MVIDRTLCATTSGSSKERSDQVDGWIDCSMD